MKHLSIAFLLFIITSCNNSGVPGSLPTAAGNAVEDKGEFDVKNGRDEELSIPYTCYGCSTLLNSERDFEKIIDEASRLAKQNLKNPLSFVPRKLNLMIYASDSLIEFKTGKRIENCLTISALYTFIGQNAYGTELEGENRFYFYLKDGVIRDFEGELQLDSLMFKSDYLNRNFYVSNSDNSFSIIPTKDKTFIVESSINCVKKGTWLLFKLANGEELKLVSWNDFNCEGKSYFNLKKSDIETLVNNKIERVTLLDKEGISASVPENEQDYFQQLMKLY